MKPFLKSAWEELRKLHAEADELYDKALHHNAEADELYAEEVKLRVEANRLYRERILDYYEPKVKIDWRTGDVEGKVLPIPIGELK